MAKTTAEKIDEIYALLHEWVPKMQEHRNALFGNGQPGLKQDVALIKQAQENCPARLATTEGRKRLGIATVMMVISGLSFVAMVVFSILNFLK